MGLRPTKGDENFRRNRSLESAGQTTDSKAPKNSRIFIGFGGPQAHGDSVENSFPWRKS